MTLLSAMEIVAWQVGDMLLVEQSQAQITEVRRQDFVTKQDHLSERLIRTRLNQLDPHVTFYGEESGGIISDKMWIVDPVDGTMRYFRQRSNWGVSIALVEGGASSVGVIFLPKMELLFSAERNGAGASCTKTVGSPRRLSTNVSMQAELSESQVGTDWCSGDHEITIDILQKLDRHGAVVYIEGCCTASMMQVALGNLDGFVHPGPKPFDIAAAGLIVEQSGGRVTDLQGNPWTPFSKSIVATNGKIHDELLSVLREGA